MRPIHRYTVFPSFLGSNIHCVLYTVSSYTRVFTVCVICLILNSYTCDVYYEIRCPLWRTITTFFVSCYPYHFFLFCRTAKEGRPPAVRFAPHEDHDSFANFEISLVNQELSLMLLRLAPKLVLRTKKHFV